MLDKIGKLKLTDGSEYPLACNLNVLEQVQEEYGTTEKWTELLSAENISSIASILPAIGQFLMGSISSFAVNAFVLVFILYFMLIGGTQMEKYIYELLPFSDTNKKNVLKEINMIVRSNAIGIPLLAVIQGGIATLGYYLFDVPSALLFGFLTCFATVIPIVGTP